VKVCSICSTEYPDDVKFCKNDGSALRGLTPAADLVGQIVAERYHVIKKLGEGGMGQVYLAEHVKMGRRSAIKVLNPAMVHDPDAVARFNREAANASRISHPHVCAIYDFGETPDGLIYLAMEFVEGEPLIDVLEREGALPVPRAARIFLQVADALQAAHDLGIVHRDLKPDNIMLARGKGGADVVKVVDFGIAKAVGGDDSQKVTKTGLVIGTPEFMSPEQLAGDVLDGRSDLYSLALVFFRTLTGILPFDADSAQETMVQRLTEDPRTLAQARPDLSFPPGLQACLDSALTRAPVDRYQTVSKFATDVAQVLGLGAAPGVPRTRSDADAPTQLLDARPAAAPRTTHPTPASAVGAPRRRSVVPIVIGAVVLLGAGGAGWAILAGGSEGDAPGGDGGQADTVRPAATNPVSGTDTRRAGGATSRPAVDVARARVLLDTLFFARLDPATAGLVLDSATAIYRAPGLSRRDSAYAAFVIGQAHFSRNDRVTGCDWIRRAIRLEPASSAYADVARQCS